MGGLLPTHDPHSHRDWADLRAVVRRAPFPPTLVRARAPACVHRPPPLPIRSAAVCALTPPHQLGDRAVAGVGLSDARHLSDCLCRQLDERALPAEHLMR